MCAGLWSGLHFALFIPLVFGLQDLHMDTHSLFSLTGRTALVTGGSRGIGKMIATGFIAQGAKVYISSRKADVCEAVAAELGPNCIAVPEDISTVEGCNCLLYTSPSPRDGLLSRMPSSA